MAICSALGWTNCQPHPYYGEDRPRGIPTGDNNWEWLPIFDSMDKAISLCDEMASRGWECVLSNGLDKTWECEFMKSADKDTPEEHWGHIHGRAVELYYAAADTLPLAINECFLRALKLWTDQPKNELSK